MNELQNEIHKSIQTDSEGSRSWWQVQIGQCLWNLALGLSFCSVWSVAIIYQKVDRGFEMTSHDTPRLRSLRAQRSESFPRKTWHSSGWNVPHNSHPCAHMLLCHTSISPQIFVCVLCMKWAYDCQIVSVRSLVSQPYLCDWFRLHLLLCDLY